MQKLASLAQLHLQAADFLVLAPTHQIKLALVASLEEMERLIQELEPFSPGIHYLEAPAHLSQPGHFSRPEAQSLEVRLISLQKSLLKTKTKIRATTVTTK